MLTIDPWKTKYGGQLIRLHMNLPRWFALAALIAITATAFAREIEAGKLLGANCDLGDPPTESGEIFMVLGRSQVYGRVYPRLSQLPKDYTGCQVLWASMNGGPTLRSVTLLLVGRVIAAQPAMDLRFCGSNERASETKCTPRRTTLHVSYPPGCVANLIESKAMPTDCLDAMQKELTLYHLVRD